MTDHEPDAHDDTAGATTPGTGIDPRNTDHPAGEEQAAENAANDSPS